MIPRQVVGVGMALVLLGLSAAGCSNFPRVYWPRLSNGGVTAETVLGYYRKAGTLNPATVRKEIDRLREAYRERSDDETLFQLVVLTLQPGRPPSDRQLAFDLLKDFRQRGRAENSLLTLTVLLENQLGEQLRLAGERDKARQRAEELEKTSRELQNKLRALEDIEKILRQRER